MRRTNQAVQAILNLNSAKSSANLQSWDNGQVLMADSAWEQMEENISSQEENDENCENNQGVNNQEVIN